MLRAFERRFPDRAQAAVAEYRSARPDHTPGQLVSAMQTDETFRVPARRLSEARAARGNATWMYWFTWPTPAFGGIFGSCHAVDVPFVFHNLDRPGVEVFTGDGDDRAPVADAVAGALLRFASDGKPGWNSYDLGDRATRRFDVDAETLLDPEPSLRELWAAAGTTTPRYDDNVMTGIGSITDVPGVRVGHAQRVGRGWLTGTTVVSIPRRRSPGCRRPRRWPRNAGTDALDPRNLVDLVHAVCLTGGSAYGLAAADGVMDVLARRGLGVRVGPGASDVVPVVPAAVIFDLGRGGDFGKRPDAGFGRRALIAARASPPARGAVGAGTGAVAGGLQGGVGTSSARLTFGGRRGRVRRSRQCRRGRGARGGQCVRRRARSEHRVAVGGRRLPSPPSDHR